MAVKDFRSRKVKNQRPIATEEEHRVLQFRPRNSVRLPSWRGHVAAPLPRQEKDAALEPPGLSRYERPPPDPDDFPHPMLGNIAGFAFTLSVMGISAWPV